MTDSKTFKIISPLIEHAQAIADFNVKLAAETENKTLDPVKTAENEKLLISMASSEPYKEVIKASPGFYLLAIEEATQLPIGCMMITYEMNLEVGGLLYCMQSVYVDKAFRHRGVFKELFNTGLNYAKLDEFCKGMRLYVDKTNETA